MYDNQFARTRTARRSVLVAAVSALIAVGALASTAAAQDYDSASVIRKISGLSDKLELTTNTSRILTLDKNIPRVQVNDPTLLAVTPLSATQVQISAKKPGVTQVNLWDEEGVIHTVDVMIYGDARELSVALQTQFPHSSIRVYRYSESLVLTGFVDRPDHVGPIMRLAEDYAPKVINNINVGGVQQILLKVKIMEINRTKLRKLGVDWAWFGGGGDFAVSRPNDLISEFSSSARSVEMIGETFSFGVISDSAAFFGVLDALQNRELGKILAEPNIVAVSGRPAQFIVGGETPILIPQSLGTSSIEFKSFGTILDFLPIVLGNGNIRLEVRPQVTQLNFANGIDLNDIRVPGFDTRRVDTAVEMKAGQTFALAGLIQEKTFSQNSGIPYLADVPVLGVPFRKTENRTEEVELLVIVTPEFVDPIDACEAPCGGPGTFTTSPDNCTLYCGGQIEVPAHCNPKSGLGTCGDDYCSGANCNAGCSTCNSGGGNGMVMSDGTVLPGGTGYEGSMGPVPSESTTITDEGQVEPAPTAPEDLSLPTGAEPNAPVTPPQSTEPAGPMPTPPADSGTSYPTWQPAYGGLATQQQGATAYGPRPHSPPRQPVFVRNSSRPNNPNAAQPQPAASQGQNSLIGPVGYDVQ